ncbi:uncharacterized protein METZ01_LOCUS116082 [marine metagenome]|uniref:Uncharacterized protein n=1 Tax=marine metagenome TaxID=408172 RepID=A0A381XEU1_9ZZZZ
MTPKPVLWKEITSRPWMMCPVTARPITGSWPASSSGVSVLRTPSTSSSHGRVPSGVYLSPSIISQPSVHWADSASASLGMATQFGCEWM